MRNNKFIWLCITIWLVIFLFSCGKEQATLYKLKGKWRAVATIENGVESFPSGDIFMFYHFEYCHSGNDCHVRIGLTENGQSEEFDSELYEVSGDGKIIYFSGHPWDILKLDKNDLQIRNEEDSLEIKFKKL